MLFGDRYAYPSGVSTLLKRAARVLGLLAMLAGVLPMAGPAAQAAPQAQSSCQRFAETGQTVCGRFLDYWKSHGGLAQQGYPISPEFNERSSVDGNTYRVQYFERAVFEYHPENRYPNDVLLSLLGSMRVSAKYRPGDIEPAWSSAELSKMIKTGGARYFPETGVTATGLFYTYWLANGGLAQQGYPITEAFYEKNDLDGKWYIVQYFERAVFEFHGDLPAGRSVLLSQLGTFRFKQKYPNGVSSNPLPPTPRPATPRPVVTPRTNPTPRATPNPVNPGAYPCGYRTAPPATGVTMGDVSTGPAAATYYVWELTGRYGAVGKEYTGQWFELRADGTYRTSAGGSGRWTYNSDRASREVIFLSGPYQNCDRFYEYRGWKNSLVPHTATKYVREDTIFMFDDAELKDYVCSTMPPN